jgi:hypothetical protein
MNLMEHKLKREKLYEQIRLYPNDLPKLDPDKLFLLLKTEKSEGVIQFKNYSEFLNIANTLLFFYVRYIYN